MNIMTKAAITGAIAGLSLGACAQHDVSIGLAGATNYATMMVSNNGTIDIAAVELFTGTFRHGGAVVNSFGSSLADFGYGFGDGQHYGVATYSFNGELAAGERTVMAVNFDELVHSEMRTFSGTVTSPDAFTNMRLLVVWVDGYEHYIGMPISTIPALTTFNFTDVPAVPEPGQAAMLFAGLGVLALVRKKT